VTFSAAQDVKEQVRAATDIVALVGAERPVIKKGRDFVALCPFHQDKNPSLVLNQVRQSWRCWSCGDGGDVFSYVMKRENIDFRGALQILADQAGIELKQSGPKAKPGSPSDKTTLFKAMAWAETQFHRFLLEGAEAAPAREYLNERQINEETIERYKIGYAPDEWQWLIDRGRSASFTPAILEALGLVVRKEGGRAYDFFRGRVIFPIRDAQDRPIGVGGRIMPQFAGEGVAKYYNPPATILYAKSKELYGLNACREDLDQLRREKKPRNVIVMEGYTDVVVSRQAGVLNPVAVCGTALTEHHVTLVSRFADQLTLVFDGDEAGTEKAKKLAELYLAAQIELQVAIPPDGLDPCDFVLERGVSAFDELVNESFDALDFTMNAEVKGIDTANDSIATAKAYDRVATMLSQCKSSSPVNDSALRVRVQLVARRIARKFRLETDYVIQDLNNRISKNPYRNSQPAVEPITERKPELHGWEADLFVLLIQNPDAIAAVIENVGEMDLRTELGRSLLVIYQDLEAEGRIADYDNVMAAIEAPSTKSVMVELAEEADRKQGEDTELQLRELLEAFENRRGKQERQSEKAELESGSLSEEQERDLLRRLFPPTD